MKSWKKWSILGALFVVGMGFHVWQTQTTKNKIALLRTNKGEVHIKLYDGHAPRAVKNFIGLAQAGRYDGNPFHRVVEGFIIQGGDYEFQNGEGGQSIWGRYFEDEFSDDLSHVRGALSMANHGPHTNGSQFFILVGDAPQLDGKHTIFGQVIEGMEVVDIINRVDTKLFDHPVDPVIIEEVLITDGQDVLRAD